MATRETIKEELVKKFPEDFSTKSDLLEACGDIGQYLSTTANYNDGLLALEKKLETRLGDKYTDAQKYYRDLKKYWNKMSSKSGAKFARKPKKDDAFSHVVTSELRSVEKQYGFSSAEMIATDALSVISTVEPREDTPTLLGFAHYDLFRQQVSAGQIWKDPSVANGHGENTHRLQWYLIAANKVIQTGSFADKPCDVYKGIGGIVFAKDRRFGLWDAIVDRGDVTAEHFPAKEDARSPEYLMKYIKNHQKSLPLLQAYLTARDKKPFELNEGYLARKIFGKELDQLDTADKDLVEMVYADYRNKTILIIPETGQVVLDSRVDHIEG